VQDEDTTEIVFPKKPKLRMRERLTLPEDGLL
jgi:hypothetical protein